MVAASWSLTFSLSLLRLTGVLVSWTSSKLKALSQFLRGDRDLNDAGEISIDSDMLIVESALTASTLQRFFLFGFGLDLSVTLESAVVCSALDSPRLEKLVMLLSEVVTILMKSSVSSSEEL